MNTLLKTALIPAATYITNASSSDVEASNGGYVGLDFSEFSTFAGLQGRIQSSKIPVLFAPSFEASTKRDRERWQLNADVLSQFSPLSSFQPYTGAGLCLVRDSDKQKLRPGVNLLGGLQVKLGGWSIFAQLRLTVADGIRFSAAGGTAPKKSG